MYKNLSGKDNLEIFKSMFKGVDENTIKEILNKKEEPVVFILWGNYAREKKAYITNPIHYVIESPHPSPLSASRGFFGSKPFSKTNNFLKKNNISTLLSDANPEETINLLLSQQEKEIQEELRKLEENLEKTRILQKELKAVSKISVESIGDIVEVMKNKSSKRTMVIPNMAYELLKEQKERQEIYKEMFGKSYNHEFDDYVCVDPMGNLLKPGYITDHFSVLLKKIGMRHIRFHDLRHTVASLLINNGVPITHVSDYLGHADIKITANTYGHLDKASKSISANVINSVLNNSL